MLFNVTTECRNDTAAETRGILGELSSLDCSIWNSFAHFPTVECIAIVKAFYVMMS